MEGFLKLTELSHLIEEALVPITQKAFWVVAEISDIKASGRGHQYLELVEKLDGKLVAKQSAVIWFNRFRLIQSQLGKDTRNILQKGNKVLFQLKLEFHPLYGMKLQILSVDPRITIGELEKKRMEIILRLEKGGWFEPNKAVPLPEVIQRVAVISSPTAAGYEDFVEHLFENQYGYTVTVNLFPAAMQGVNLAGEVSFQLDAIAEREDEFDAVVIIRGGGSKLDLEAFNNFDLGVQVAKMPLPVITGIGHQQDATVFDLVAHSSVKTPTAAADFVLDSFLNFERSVILAFSQIREGAELILEEQEQALDFVTNQLASLVSRRIDLEELKLKRNESKLDLKSNYLLQTANSKLDYFEKVVAWYDISKILKKGFSITRKNGKVISDASKLKKGDQIKSQFASGEKSSTIN